jgi:hypothetical protein
MSVVCFYSFILNDFSSSSSKCFVEDLVSDGAACPYSLSDGAAALTGGYRDWIPDRTNSGMTEGGVYSVILKVFYFVILKVFC